METFVPKGNIHGPILPQFVLRKSITFGAKTMYALLCDYAADKDHCWPSQATLAKRLSCSISSIKNYLAELVREKLISVKREQDRSYYLLRPEERIEKQVSKFVRKQPEAGSYELKSGYITTLSKQQKKLPLPPVEPETSKVRPASRAPAAGVCLLLFWILNPPGPCTPKMSSSGFSHAIHKQYENAWDKKVPLNRTDSNGTLYSRSNKKFTLFYCHSS